MAQGTHKYMVYLAGPITGCNDDQQKRWRNELKQAVYRLRNCVFRSKPNTILAEAEHCNGVSRTP